jgi:hemoglobin/transferrin/lactoferrin receptor protein
VPGLFRLWLLATPAFLVLPAAGQEAPAPLLTPLDAITTTATRTPQVAGDVAAPVSVVPREELRRRQPTSLQNIIGDMPGVEADGIPRASVQQPQIRGLGGDRVITTLDGVRQNFSSGHRGRFFFEPELLRQVDVLRGPASMLYGSGAIGGVIALRTIEAEDIIRPGRATGFFLSQGYDTNGGRWRSAGAAAFRAGELDGLLGFARNAGSNIVDGAGQTIPFTDPTTMTVLARLGWNPMPGMRFGFSFMNREEDQVIPSAANTLGTSDITDRTLRAQQFSLNFNWAPPDNPWLDLRAQIYRNTIGINERRIVPLDNRRDTTDLETLGLSVQNTARFSLFGAERHALTIGFDGYTDNQVGRRNGAPRNQFPEASQEVVGLFLQDEITLGAATLTGGLRYDRFAQEATGQRDTTSDRLSPRVSLAYRVTDWMQPYVSYAEAFRAPGLSQLYNSGVHFPVSVFPRPVFNTFVPNPNLRPETSRNIEAGVNFRFRDTLATGDSLRIRASAFRNNLDDFIETIVTATTTEQRNVTRARIQGLELEGQYESGAWFAGLGASLLRGENRSQGGPLSLIPAHKLSVSLGRRFQEQGVTLGGRVQLVAEQGRKAVDAQTGIRPAPTAAYALTDLFVTWAPPEGPLAGVRLDVGVANLFDVRHRRLAWDSGSERSSFFDVGRNVQFRLSANF